VNEQQPRTTTAEKYDEYVMPITKGYDPFTVERAEGTTMNTAERTEYLGVGGYHKNVGRFQPPLTITREELDRAVTALEDGLRCIE
jgi:4-aminobutyrate aminotransferase-like enzyme